VEVFFVPPGLFIFYHFTKMTAQKTLPKQVQQDAEPSTESKLTIVKFHNTKISCTQDSSGQVWVGINPICEAIGIDVKRAMLTIKSDSILGAMVSEQTLLDAKNRRFPMQCIPIQYVHGWLFMIQENKVNEKAKPKLKSFKLECYQVLFDHFYGKYRLYEQNMGKRIVIHSRMNSLTIQRIEITKELSSLKKQLQEIETNEFSGQLQLAVQGGNA
jgi:hypothetical protein